MSPPNYVSSSGNLPSSSTARLDTTPDQTNQEEFNVFVWHTHMQSCRRYFLDQGQHDPQVQALAAFVNIKLPYQRGPMLMLDSMSSWSLNNTSQSPLINIPSAVADRYENAGEVSLVPYIRRIVATAFDTPEVLEGLFGSYWQAGVGQIHEMERRNYLFACKSSNWLAVKNDYDLDDGQAIPFLKALLDPTEDEIKAAEVAWSEWLAMQDWIIGPRAYYDQHRVFVGQRDINSERSQRLHSPSRSNSGENEIN